MNLFNFLRYNNAVPVALSIVVLGAGGAFAATSPDTIYSETQRVVSIDNTYLVSKDLSSYSPRTQIVSVTEDAENYYVAYIFYTINLEEAVWRDTAKEKVLKVSKVALGVYRDLGVYVTQQLKENIDAELRRLVETQNIERKNVTQKILATEYGGLIGKVLDTTMETIPGYTPVVVAPVVPEQHTQVASAASSVQGSEVPQPTSSSQSSSDAGAPTIQVLGNNPARIPMGTDYADLGAVITGPSPADTSLGVHLFVEGKEVQTVSIDTSSAKVWTIQYEATNANGNVGRASRIVEIYDPAAEAAAAAAQDAESLSTTTVSSETTAPETSITTVSTSTASVATSTSE